MKKAKIIIALLVVFAVCFGLAACKTAEYTLNKTTLSLEEGQTQQLTVSSSLDNEFTVEYKSSDATIATVSASGLVTAVKAGEATITATVEETELTCKVTVTEAAKPVEYSYALSKTEITIVEGGYQDISVTVTPNKTISVTYTSANTAIATVNANGRITAVAVGETTIKAAVDGKELTCKVTVEKAPPTYTLKAEGTPLTEGGKTLIEKGSTLKFVVTSSEADDEFTVQWSTSNNAIATVDQNGTVTGVGNGNVTITAKIGDIEKTSDVQVFTYQYTYPQTLALDYGTTDAQLTVSVDHGKTLDISFVLPNEDVIAIDDKGNIEIKNVGTVTVTIKDGDTTIGECAVTVNAVFTAPKAIQMHVGNEKDWTITANPAETDFTPNFAVAEGSDVISIEDGKITALKNGTAKVTATIGDTVLTCDVIVNDLNATIEYKDIANEDKEQLSGSDVAYWENYINNEINYKAINDDEEDVIERIFGQGHQNYIPDFVYLIWTDGDDRCVKPSKPDGFSEGTLLGVQNQDPSIVPQITLNIKVYAGQTTIKLYAGAFKCHNIVTISNNEEEIARYDIQPNGENQRKSLLTFSVDAKETMTLTIVLTLSQPTADNSFITIGAVSVSGSTYQLEETGTRLAPEGTTTIVMNKDGEALTEGVTFEVTEGEEYISLNTTTGEVTANSIGTATIKVTADGRVRYFTVEVGYAYSLDVDKAQLHKGETHQITVVSDPVGAEIVAQFESTDEAIATVSTSGLVEAVANGTVVIKVRVDEKELELTVTVSDVLATSTITRLEKDKDNPIDLTDGAEYWEQYIANGEVNHKHYVTVEEDIIDKTSTVDGNYLSDYPAFISWNGGANGSNCSCGHCNKDTQNGGDGGWNGDAGTKAMAVNVKDAVIALQFKLFAGESVIKIFTGGYNLIGRVQLKLDGAVIAEETFNNKGAHISHMVAFTVNAVNACEVTAELVMIDDSGNAPYSCISLAAASVSGDVYQLAKTSERIAPTGAEHSTTQIVMNKNGAALADGVTYTVVEGNDLVTVDGNGLVTAIGTNGVAKVKVTADGRERVFTVNVGYVYEIDSSTLTLKPNETHQIVITSTPEGSASPVTYTSGDTDVATVDANGLITAVGNGSTTITAEVDGVQLEVAVAVSGIAVTATGRNIDGEFIDLTRDNVLYYEHCLWNELATKKLGEGEEDLIDLGELVSEGNENYGAYMYFANADGAKSAAGNDKAYKKYTKINTDYEINVTVPVGTYEIRIYTGTYNATLVTSLILGEQTLNSYTIDQNGRTSNVVVFTVTVEEKTTFKVLMDLDGELNRFAGAAIATPDVSRDATTSVTVSSEETQGDTTTQVNLSEKGTLDWIYYNTEFGGGNNGNIAKKADGSYINNEKISTWNEWDFRAGITWTDGDGNFDATAHPDGDTGRIGDGHHNNFVADEIRLLATVKVDETVQTITLYVSGYQSTYNVFVYDSNGNLLVDEVVCSEANGGSRAFAVTLNITATQADSLRVGIYKVNGNNIGMSAIAVAGAAE